MLENSLRDNGNQYYKFATITVRVFVDKNEVEQEMDRSVDPVNGEQKNWKTEEEVFDAIAKEKIRDMFKSDEPCKLCDISLS